jgi:hypothetical protein
MSNGNGHSGHCSVRGPLMYKSGSHHLEGGGEVTVEQTVEPSTRRLFRAHPRASALLIAHYLERSRHQEQPDTDYMARATAEFEGVLANPAPRHDQDPVMAPGVQAEALHLWSLWQTRPPAATEFSREETKAIGDLRVQGKSHFANLAAACLPPGALPEELCQTLSPPHPKLADALSLLAVTSAMTRRPDAVELFDKVG